MSFVRGIFGWVTFFILMCGVFYVLKYSSYWDSQVHPSKDVTVYWKEGELLKGDLSWSLFGEMIITNSDGEVHILNDRPHAIFYGVKDPESPSRSFLAAWRSWLPALIYLSFVARYYLFPLHDDFSFLRSKVFGKSR